MRGGKQNFFDDILGMKGISDIASLKVEPFIRINPLFLLLLGAPVIYEETKSITKDCVFKNSMIVYGPCPSCEAANRLITLAS